jgi:hypothetical protein
MEISILAHMKEIKRMDMEGMFGQMDACMRADLQMMLSKYSSI